VGVVAALEGIPLQSPASVYSVGSGRMLQPRIIAVSSDIDLGIPGRRSG